MSKRISKREQVVEFLRCAADDNDTRRGAGLNGLFGAEHDLGCSFTDPIVRKAWNAKRAVQAEGWPLGPSEAYRRLLLEAAQRVEDGDYP